MVLGSSPVAVTSPFTNISIANFEQVNVFWIGFHWTFPKYTNQSQLAFSCSKSAIERLEKDVKYVQS